LFAVACNQTVAILATFVITSELASSGLAAADTIVHVLLALGLEFLEISKAGTFVFKLGIASAFHHTFVEVGLAVLTADELVVARADVRSIALGGGPVKLDNDSSVRCGD
jgi:hypothetical protein